MAKNKKSITEKVKDVVKKVAQTSLLRDASTGAFYEGTAPKDISPSGTFGGRPFYEV